jgi:hypothetical protein
LSKITGNSFAMKNILSKSFFILSLLLGFVVCSTCTKLEKAMLVTTGDVTNILTNTADASGLIIDLGDGATQHGHCYAITPNVTIASSKTELGIPPGTGGFTSRLTNLTAGTKYYIKAYITNGPETAYGSETSFTTVSASLPTLTTTAIASVTTTTASSGGNISNDGGAPVTARGVCWNTTTSPTTANSKTTDGTGTGSFISSLTSLTANTTYYIRAYATNSAGTAYGNELTFKTGAVAPTVFTTDIKAVTTNSATGGGNIPNDGGASVTMRGVCWGTSHNPTTANSNTIDGTGLGSFVSNLTGLTANTTYYVRAYAFNGIDIGYGNELSFTTSAVVVLVPTLTTTAIGSVTSTSASSGGSITSDGGAAIISVGVCWSITSGPTIASNKTIDVLAGSTFLSSITGLSLGVTYYVRAYATNSAGAAYGNEISFTTVLAIGDSYQGGKVAYILKLGDPGYVAGQTRGIIAAKDDLSTGAGWGCFGITITGADGTSIGTGNQNTTDIMAGCSTAGIAAKLCNDLVFDGYSDWYLPSKDELNKLYISQSAIGGFSLFNYWSSTEISNNEAGLQNFSSGIQPVGFKDGINYVRAVRAFPPVPVLPAVTTTAISSITSTTATSGGNILSDGGAAITARGVCWSITLNPTIANSKTSDGTGTGIFTSSITGLSAPTTYYVRAYATNSAGTAYGNEISFSASSCTSFTLTHNAGSVAPVTKTVTYGVVLTNLSGSNKCWITQNLGADNQATSATDASEVAAGWYWQFNRQQGYKHDGTNRTPNTTWITSIDEASDWIVANDPCAILLGTGWRIPTQTEWTNADNVSGWNNYNDTYASTSGLKLHPAGYLSSSTGSLSNRGSFGGYWSNVQFNNTSCWALYSNNSVCIVSTGSKADGWSVRCIRD